MYTKEEKNWAIFIHLMILGNYIIPLSGIIGLLISWFFLSEKMPILKEHTRQALNFHISMVVYALIGAFLGFITFGLLTFIITPLIAVATIIFSIFGASRAANEEVFQYPFTLNFITR